MFIKFILQGCDICSLILSISKTNFVSQWYYSSMVIYKWKKKKISLQNRIEKTIVFFLDIDLFIGEYTYLKISLKTAYKTVLFFWIMRQIKNITDPLHYLVFLTYELQKIHIFLKKSTFRHICTLNLQGSQPFDFVVVYAIEFCTYLFLRYFRKLRR